MTGFVYAIDGGNGLVKIGWSRDPLRRLYALKTDCPGDAKLLGVVAATQKQEREIHALLAEWRRRREWFEFSGAVVAFVGMLSQPRPQIAVVNTEGMHPLAKWLLRVGMKQGEAAKAMGISQGRISQIIQGEWPSKKTAEKIIFLTNGAVSPADYVSFRRQSGAAQ